MARAFFLIVLSIIIISASAQTTDLSDDLSSYQLQSKTFSDEIRKISGTARFEKPGRVLKPQDLSDAVVTFNRRWGTRAALLCYFYNRKKAKLSGYLLDERGMVSSFSKKVSTDSMLQEELELRHSIGVYRSSSLDRSVSTMGFSLRPKGAENDSNLVYRAASLFLPPQLADSLLHYDQLLIAPTLNLYSFPFAVLKPFENGKYLGTVIPICILPGLYEFTARNSITTAETFSAEIQKATIVGNPKFNAQLHPRDYYGRHPLIDEFFLQDLPYTEAQTTAVRTLLVDNTGKVTIDFLSQYNATKSNFLKSALNSDLIYLATHGFSSTRKPWDSSFVAFAKEGTIPGGNFLSAREIVTRRYPARFVVLSACQTGTGQLWDAGVMSLASAFYYAGAENVISTLWNVDDFFTSMYMRELMKGLLENGTRHPSYYLHQVQKSAKSSPRNWAPFICFGR